jgi:hypothetical protein
MEESAWRETIHSVNDRPCAFYKAVLRRCAGCSRAQRLLIAEREAVACISPGAQPRCMQLLEALRTRSIFALRLTHLDGMLPHGKEIKVQCGGLLGLQQVATEGEIGERVEDIHRLIDLAVSRYGAIDALPFSEVVKSIVHFQSRPNQR